MSVPTAVRHDKYATLTAKRGPVKLISVDAEKEQKMPALMDLRLKNQRSTTVMDAPEKSKPGMAGDFVTRPSIDGRSIVQLYESDLHENFKDLNPIYFKLRKQRVAACAKRYLRRIGEVLLQRVKSEKRRILNNQFEGGRRLSTEQIADLTATLKKDYTKYVDRDLDSSKKHTQNARKLL